MELVFNIPADKVESISFKNKLNDIISKECTKIDILSLLTEYNAYRNWKIIISDNFIEEAKQFIKFFDNRAIQRIEEKKKKEEELNNKRNT